MGLAAAGEVLFCNLVLALFFSVLAVFVAFVNRIAARFLAIGSMLLSVLFTFSLLQMNQWNLFWVIETLFSSWLVMPMFHGSLALSLIAAFAPLRRPAEVRPDGTRTEAGPRWKWLALYGSVVAMAIGILVFKHFESQQGDAKTVALFEGDPNVRLKSFVIKAGQGKVICTDPEILREMESRMRRRQSGPLSQVSSHEMTLTFEGFGSNTFATYWTDDVDFELFIGMPGEGGKGYVIRLTPPRIEGLDIIVDFLKKPVAETAGQVLYLESNGRRIEQDRSLIAR